MYFHVSLLHAAARVVCCVLCVAAVPCCALVVEYNASRMLLAVRCPLLAAHEMRQCRMFPIASRMCSRPLACRRLSDACCVLHALPVVCRLLRGVCRITHVALLSLAMLSVVRCTLSVVFSTLPVVRCMLHVACCLARCTSLLLFAAYCSLHGACCLDVACCMLRVVCCISPAHVVSCAFSGGLLHAVTRVSSAALLSVGSCPLHVVCCLLPVARSPLSVACCTLHVVRCLLSIACCLPQCPLSHGVRCPSPVQCRISSRCMLRVAFSLLHVVALSVACPIFHVVCHMSSVATLQNDTAPSRTQRIAEALAIV
jgi:hypothetical protein